MHTAELLGRRHPPDRGRAYHHGVSYWFFVGPPSALPDPEGARRAWAVVSRYGLRSADFEDGYLCNVDGSLPPLHEKGLELRLSDECLAVRPGGRRELWAPLAWDVASEAGWVLFDPAGGPTLVPRRIPLAALDANFGETRRHIDGPGDVLSWTELP